MKQAAKASGRTISDELAFRWAMSFEWEKAFTDTRKLLDDARRSIEGELHQAMRGAGLIQVYGVGGSYWMERGMAPLQMELGPELKALVTEIVKLTLAEAKEESQ
jgi:hypothetical protein